MKPVAWAVILPGVLAAAAGAALGADGPRAVLCAIYGGEARAEEALERLRQAEEQGLVKIESYTLLVKAREGTISRRIDLPARIDPDSDALAGVAALAAVAGAVAGLLIGRWEGSFIGYVGGIEETTPDPDPDPILEGAEEAVGPGEALVLARVRERVSLEPSPYVRALPELRARQRLERELPAIRQTRRGPRFPVEEVPPAAARAVVSDVCATVP